MPLSFLRKTPFLLVILMLALTAIARAAQPTPEEFASNFLSALEKGEFDQAYNELAAPFQAQTSLPTFIDNYRQTRQRLGALGRGQDLFKTAAGRSVRNFVGATPVFLPQVQSPATQVRFRATYPETVAFEDVYLVPMGDNWKVIGISISPGY